MTSLRQSLIAFLTAVLTVISQSAIHSRSVRAADLGSIQAQLDTGEFSAAVNAAQAMPAGPDRDAVLSQIAVAQNRAGARGAAINSAMGMSSDQSRAATIGQFGTGLPQDGKGRPGGNQADFDSLIDLITSTIAPTTWSDAGGTGSIAPFPTGVYVDAQGALLVARPPIVT